MRPIEVVPASGGDRLAVELAGLDRLEIPRRSTVDFAHRLFRATWPKVAAIAIAIGLWQLIVLSGWKPTYLLPSPAQVGSDLWRSITDGSLGPAIAVTLRRAAFGYTVAVVIGLILGVVVSRSSTLRAAVGSFITGLQTMPSIAWFPLAILLFGLSETAILFVVILGAAPAIANGLLAGVDHVPPLLIRAGRTLGARGLTAYRFVILPAAFPSTLAGLKQGWAFAWRSLMAGELLVIIAHSPSLGVQLQFAREVSDAPALIAGMIVILAIGVIVDGVLFGFAERMVRIRYGLGQ